MRILSFVLGLLFASSALASELTIVAASGETETVKTTVLAERFPAEPVVTANPWAPAQGTYKGIDLSALLDHYGLAGMSVRLSALDNYSVVMNPGDVADFKNPILAIEKDGKALSRRDFGPSWLIIDFDRYPELDTERARNLSVWQLTEISPE